MNPILAACVIFWGVMAAIGLVYVIARIVARIVRRRRP